MTIASAVWRRWKGPPSADIGQFKEGIQCAARIYARDARILDDNAVHHEIESLYRAAEERDCQRLARLIESLSPRAARLLNERAARPSLAISFPAVRDFHNTRRQTAACAKVASLCCVGGHNQGRNRPTGKKSRTWQPLLHAPKPRRNFSKRDAERNFVIWLRAAWRDAAGDLPSKTADHRKRGPFVRVAHECLRLVGGEHADAVGLINRLGRRPGRSRPMSAFGGKADMTYCTANVRL